MYKDEFDKIGKQTIKRYLELNELLVDEVLSIEFIDTTIYIRYTFERKTEAYITNIITFIGFLTLIGKNKIT